MPTLNHVHTYIRRSKSTYKCDHADCTHFARKEDILGKRSMCSVCLVKPIILDSEALRRVRPRCIDCSETTEAKNIRETKKVLEELGIGE